MDISSKSAILKSVERSKTTKGATMKYIVLLCDGMADFSIGELNGKTPMATAKKPTMDALAPFSVLGMAKTVPDGYKPGSDVANLSAMGFDPKTCYTGRSPLEAVSIGIDMKEQDVAFRCNLVTLSDEDEYSDKTMVDYSSSEITTEEAAKLIKAIAKELNDEERVFYSGISYRHCMIWEHGPVGLNLTPPHDISDQKITDYIPENPIIYSLMKKSYDILKNHPINLDRIKRRLHPANSIWLWGEGTKPSIPNFYDMYHVDGTVISAVDLIKGIGLAAGMDVPDNASWTGNIHTNFRSKADTAIKALLSDGKDFVYIHVESADECGHQGLLAEKIESIEKIDQHILSPLIEALAEAQEEYSILIMPDHPTPIALKTHTSDPVPFMLYRSNENEDQHTGSFHEVNCSLSGVYIDPAHELMKILLQQD